MNLQKLYRLNHLTLRICDSGISPRISGLAICGQNTIFFAQILVFSILVSCLKKSRGMYSIVMGPWGCLLEYLGIGKTYSACALLQKSMRPRFLLLCVRCRPYSICISYLASGYVKFVYSLSNLHVLLAFICRHFCLLLNQIHSWKKETKRVVYSVHCTSLHCLWGISTLQSVPPLVKDYPYFEECTLQCA